MLTSLEPNHSLHLSNNIEFGDSFLSFRENTYFLDDDSLNEVALEPSILQFYVDLYKLAGDDDREPYKDIQTSFLLAEQQYRVYSGDTFADIETMLVTLRNNPVLVFTGRFRSRYIKGVEVANALADNQKSTNAVCVDLDPLNDNTSLDPEVIETLLTYCDKTLLPTYISLSGNGLHLWYIYDESIQLFTTRSRRRERFKCLANCLYDYIEDILKDVDVKIDRQCASLSRGFRAPGSLTKDNSHVRCFCPSSVSNAHSTIDPLELAENLTRVLTDSSKTDGLPVYEDVRYLTSLELQELESKRIARAKEYRKNAPPASEAQLAFIQDLFDQGYLKDSEIKSVQSANVLRAEEIIRAGNERRNFRKNKNPKPDYKDWTVSPHRLNTDTIYRIILDNIQYVEVGNRYSSLFMLAGVAYMTTNPGITFEDLRDDFLSLLTTPWAKKGSPPLSTSDIDHAILGYCKENWRSKKSIVETLGFNPFGEPRKRNNRPRNEHLEKVARPAYQKKSQEEKTKTIAEYLKTHPCATKKEVSTSTGISYHTVLKYWVSACETAGIKDTRTGNFCTSSSSN